MPARLVPDRATRTVIRRAPLALALALALAAPLHAQSFSPDLRAQTDARIFPHWAEPGNGATAAQARAPTPQSRVVSNCADAGSGSLRDTLAAADDARKHDLG